ncbi:hypothetical protein FEM48_Zijuj10G0126300 [Ziziphus jujuba var. spinosa]|uniref:TPX2 C-terminal domain-containing protein n=1 Tax=Ziziphus jujuba var. spinosa TaxID=714518 RepID=A0A978UNF4_ZIZJJ|nr:hypothetical protein FEM48_Zijuj10G0126300 [Ziziphus jujuba var. spinosa]
MAGEIEEPFSINFRADSLHSGSVSFGRFENEPLSWERRSSFSHNRYLEEVEKCSTPGLVVEKKAYFEAHFKKKGHLQPGLSVCHYGTRCQVSENDGLENNSDREEFEHVDEDGHYAHFDENPQGSEYPGDYEVTKCERADPDGSEYHQECEGAECEIEDSSVLFSYPKMEPSLTVDDVLWDNVVDCIKSETIHQTETGCDKFSLSNDESGIEINKNHDGNAVNADKSSRSIDLSPKTEQEEKIDKPNLERLRTSSPKLKHVTEFKPSKAKMICKSTIAHGQRNIPGGVSKSPAKNLGRRDREAPRRIDSAKQSSNAAIPSVPSVRSTPKIEDSRGMKGKLVHENKSGEKELKGKKFGDSLLSSLNAEPRGRKTASRTNRAVSCTKPAAKSSAASFSFKSDERAERRKEFYQKLEEKMHAKEAEMNKIQARTQEKTEAEIKKLRKSLNFKATPMPSFYHVAVPPGSDGGKAVYNKTKVTKLRSKTSSSGNGDSSGLSSHLEAGNDQDPTASASVNTIESLDLSGETDCATSKLSEAPNPLTNKVCSPEASARNNVSKKKEKERDASQLKHRVSESNKVAKCQGVDGKQRSGVQRSSNNMARKGVKGIGIGSNAGMGHLTVRVSS